MTNRHNTKLRIGPVGSMEGGTMTISRYPNGEVALIIRGEGDDDYIVATVALEEAPRVAPHRVWLKGWSENEGVPEALVRAGFVRLTGDHHPSGFVAAQLAELLEPLLSEVLTVFAEI